MDEMAPGPLTDPRGHSRGRGRSQNTSGRGVFIRSEPHAMRRVILTARMCAEPCSHLNNLKRQEKEVGLYVHGLYLLLTIIGFRRDTAPTHIICTSAPWGQGGCGREVRIQASSSLRRASDSVQARARGVDLETTIGCAIFFLRIFRANHVPFEKDTAIWGCGDLRRAQRGLLGSVVIHAQLVVGSAWWGQATAA
ncbi:hypothetical protein RRG08_028851 [Elysia crispata]|uniref:Uncharacterized protein n=1 Tax=Elysia crispata TaxID=231223 RepID=A0AAE0YZ37_9GAST|nr:hypothetical protein RRG08_028851 [Elysia crispata]